MTGRALVLCLLGLSVGGPGFAAQAPATRDAHRAQVRIVGATVIVGESDPLLWEGVLDLLPVRPRRIELIDLDSLTAPARQRLQGLDAFVLGGQGTIFVIRQGMTLRQAELGDAFDRLVLASLLWHEQSHASGLDERSAVEREQALWRRFIRLGLVSAGDGMAYMVRLREAHATATDTTDAVVSPAGANARPGTTRK